MAKKILCIVALLLAVVFLLASCDNGDDAPNTPENPSHTHSYGEWEIQKAATCNEEGAAKRFCDCGETQTKTLPATGHTIVSTNAIAATCTANGYTQGKSCSTCGETIIAPQTLPATGHTYNDGIITKAATCTEDGEKTYTCSTCNNNYTETIPGGHSWNEATCTEAQTCSRCGLTDGESLGHTSSIGTCTRCNIEIYPNVNLPSAPLTLWTEDTGNSLGITELSCQFERGNLVIYFSGKANIGKYKKVGMHVQVLDENGFQVYSRSWNTGSLLDGVKFKDSIEVYSRYLNGSSEYTVIISDLT